MLSAFSIRNLFMFLVLEFLHTVLKLSSSGKLSWFLNIFSDISSNVVLKPFSFKKSVKNKSDKKGQCENLKIRVEFYWGRGGVAMVEAKTNNTGKQFQVFFVKMNKMTRNGQAKIYGMYAENIFRKLFGTHPQVFFHKWHLFSSGFSDFQDPPILSFPKTVFPQDLDTHPHFDGTLTLVVRKSPLWLLFLFLVFDFRKFLRNSRLPCRRHCIPTFTKTSY